MTELVLLLLATYAGWEAIRRLSPVGTPDLIAFLIVGVIAFVLLTWASPHILLAMAVTGGIILLANVLPFTAVTHWGPLVLALRGRKRVRDSGPRPKRKIPKLPT